MLHPDADIVTKDDRNPRTVHGRDPKQRENFQEQLERNQIKSERFASKIDNIEKELDRLPSDDEDLTKEQKKKKHELEQKLGHLGHIESKNLHQGEKLESRLASTNIKTVQHQIKQGKHKNMNEFGLKHEEDPMA